MGEFPVSLHTITPQENVLRLERFFNIEKEFMRIQGARLPDLASWSLKQKVGYFLYADSQHAQALRIRRRELRAGTREFPPLDEDLRRVLQQALFAKGDYLFCCAFYLGIKPLLVRAYRKHLQESTTFSDRPGRSVLEALIAEEELQIAWIEGALALMPDVVGAEKKAGQEWVQRIQAWIAAAGGFLKDEPVSPKDLPSVGSYNVVKVARREARQKATFAFEGPQEIGDEFQRALLTQFTAYFREMAAAETMAALLWEAPDGLPWEFFQDSARHFWDEIRHCQVGQRRLEALGLDIYAVPVQTGHYDTRAWMPLLERYAFLTQVQEAEGFEIKRQNEALFRAAGDTLSADMVAYDMADERNHVRFGTKWIPELQRVAGDSRTMEELVSDARKQQAEIWTSLSGGQQAHATGQY